MLMNNDEWVAKLQQIYKANKVYQQAKEQSQSAPSQKDTVDTIMKQSRAHDLIRQIQKVFKGQGNLRFCESIGGLRRLS